MDPEEMTIGLPPFPDVISDLLDLRTTFNSKTQTIGAWLKEHQDSIRENVALTERPTDENDLAILRIFLRELLIRAMMGEGGQRVYNELQTTLITKHNLDPDTYRKALEDAGYRWGSEPGSEVMTAVVHYFRNTLKWNWRSYLADAERNRYDNFPDDPLLQIKNVKFKVRNLALSNFSKYYPAFDLHVVRVLARTGLVAYGWDVVADPNVEFGTNPSDDKNFLFMHKLFIRLSTMSHDRFSPVDLDRVFWHLGRTKCGATTVCDSCPIKTKCLTGRRRAFNKPVRGYALKRTTHRQRGEART